MRLRLDASLSSAQLAVGDSFGRTRFACNRTAPMLSGQIIDCATKVQRLVSILEPLSPATRSPLQYESGRRSKHQKGRRNM